MEKRQKVSKNADAIEYLVEIREFHTKINSKWLTVSRYFLTLLVALIGFFFIQGTSESITNNARTAYTLYAILLIIPFILLVMMQFNLGHIRNRTRKIKRVFSVHNPYILSKLNHNDLSDILKKELQINSFQKKDEFILTDIHILANKIRTNRNLLIISMCIPGILLIVFLISYLSL